MANDFFGFSTEHVSKRKVILLRISEAGPHQRSIKLNHMGGNKFYAAVLHTRHACGTAQIADG
jgi:hypothetical protein